jgi:hypothetical protein
MNTDEFTLIETFATITTTGGTTDKIAVADDLDTAWEQCQYASADKLNAVVTLVRIGTHSNYGNPLTGTTTTPFVRGQACNTATRYS